MAFDSTPQLIDDPQAGWLDSIVVQAPFAMGYKAAQAMGMHLSGEKPAARIDSGARLIRKDSMLSDKVLIVAAARPLLLHRLRARPGS